MATLGTQTLTLADWAKRMDPDGTMPQIVEMLSETNEILTDAGVMEGNLPTGHRVTIRTGLPAVYWRAMNEGVPPSKSTSKQVDETTGMLEAYAEVDKAAAELNGGSAAWRMSEEAPFTEAMSQEQAKMMFYGNPADNPRHYLGLSPRYSAISTDKNQTGYNIIDGGGTGSDNTSVWFVTWHDQSTFLTFPKGSQAGLQRRDLGEETLTDSAGGMYQGYRTHYKWDNGLVLKDWRDTVRVANIDVSALTGDGSTGTDLISVMVKAWHRIEHQGRGRTAIYCNRTIQAFLDEQAMNKTNVNLTISEWAGQPVTLFRGLPIRRCEQLLETESRVT